MQPRSRAKPISTSMWSSVSHVTANGTVIPPETRVSNAKLPKKGVASSPYTFVLATDSRVNRNNGNYACSSQTATNFVNTLVAKVD